MPSPGLGHETTPLAAPGLNEDAPKAASALGDAVAVRPQAGQAVSVPSHISLDGGLPDVPKAITSGADLSDFGKGPTAPAVVGNLEFQGPSIQMAEVAKAPTVFPEAHLSHTQAHGLKTSLAQEGPNHQVTPQVTQGSLSPEKAGEGAERLRAAQNVQNLDNNGLLGQIKSVVMNNPALVSVAAAGMAAYFGTGWKGAAVAGVAGFFLTKVWSAVDERSQKASVLDRVTALTPGGSAALLSAQGKLPTGKG